MSCLCWKDNEKRIAEHMKDKAGDNVEVECGGMAILLSKEKLSLSEGLYMPYYVKGSKVGFRSQRGTPISMFFNYCPWCGKKIKPDEGEAPAAANPA